MESKKKWYKWTYLQNRNRLTDLEQGSPTPRPWTGTGPWPVRNWPHSRRWAAGVQAKLHLYLQLLPIAHITAWALPPVRSAAALDSHKSTNSTVNCACEGSRLHAPYENLMSHDLRWSWGGDASAGEWLQIQIIISREVWLHRDHNKSTACRLISQPYQSGKWKQAQGSHWFCIMVSCIIISLHITM